MQYGRRTTDRRRRVLYSTRAADSSKPSASSRRATAKLREARNPTAVYGSRVNRRLRGRWFSLVPVRRRSLAAVSLVVGFTALALCLLHYFSVTWAWFAERPDVARPLRLDRPDSFGHWVLCIMLAASSGISFLVYQLRRHRNDDFRGHYQLWRLLTFVLLVGSVHSLVGLLHWGGAILDAILGQRVALTGNDWLRLLISVGGAILALRLVAEVRRSRFSLLFVLPALVFFAIPEAVNWNLMKVETIGRWSLVTSAPLIGCTTLFLGLVGYLRMVFRDVRKIEDTETIPEKLRQLKAQFFGLDDDYEEIDESSVENEHEPKRRWWRRRKKDARPDRLGEREPVSQEEYDEDQYEDEYEEEDEYAEEQLDDSDDLRSSDEDSPKRSKRRWFGLRRSRDADLVTESNEADEQEDDVAEEEPKQKRKRRGWSLRLKPQATSAEEAADREDDGDAEELDEAAAASEEDAQPKKKRFSLGWRKNKNKNTQAEDDTEPTDESDYDEPEPAYEPEQAEEELDPDDIDWDSLSKSERRRLRKKLKRQKRAA